MIVYLKVCLGEEDNVRAEEVLGATVRPIRLTLVQSGNAGEVEIFMDVKRAKEIVKMLEPLTR